MDSINFETYFARLQVVRRELKTLECLCLAGKVGEPLGDGHNGLRTADDAEDQYKAMGNQIVAALAELGITLGPPAEQPFTLIAAPRRETCDQCGGLGIVYVRANDVADANETCGVCEGDGFRTLDEQDEQSEAL